MEGVKDLIPARLSICIFFLKTNIFLHEDTPMDFTDNLNESIVVTITGNSLNVLGKNFILPKPVVQKQVSYDPTKSIYITVTNNGAIIEAVEVSIDTDATFTLVPTVTYNRYYTVADKATLTATSVTVLSGNVVATIDPANAQSAGFVGTSFILNGALLTAKTIITSA